MADSALSIEEASQEEVERAKLQRQELFDGLSASEIEALGIILSSRFPWAHRLLFSEQMPTLRQSLARLELALQYANGAAATIRQNKPRSSTLSHAATPAAKAATDHRSRFLQAVKEAGHSKLLKAALYKVDDSRLKGELYREAVRTDEEALQLETAVCTAERLLNEELASRKSNPGKKRGADRAA